MTGSGEQAERKPMNALLNAHAAVWGRPGVWIGLGLTAAFLFIAIRLRRDREPT